MTSAPSDHAKAQSPGSPAHATGRPRYRGYRARRPVSFRRARKSGGRILEHSEPSQPGNEPTEVRVQESEEPFRLMFERNPLPSWVCDQQTYGFVEVNSAAIRHYGYSREEFLTMSLPQLYPSEHRAALMRRMSELRAAQGPSLPRIYDDIEHQLKSGEVRHVRVVAQDLTFADRDCVIAIITDITEARQHEQALLQFASTQSLLLRQLTHAEEAERRRLAMDIHDGPLQSLGVAALGLDRAMRRRARGEHELAEQELSLVRSTLREATDELRSTLADLSQEVLVNYGLGVALHKLADRLARLTSTSIHVYDTLNTSLDKHLELLLYRLAQEALSNVRKHADAHRAYVHLRSDDSFVIVQVADDGKGFDVERALQKHIDGKALGLRSMRERIESAGGEMEIISTRGEGTILTFRYPLGHAQNSIGLFAQPWERRPSKP